MVQCLHGSTLPGSYLSSILCSRGPTLTGYHHPIVYVLMILSSQGPVPGVLWSQGLKFQGPYVLWVLCSRFLGVLYTKGPMFPVSFIPLKFPRSCSQGPISPVQYSHIYWLNIRILTNLLYLGQITMTLELENPGPWEHETQWEHKGRTEEPKLLCT